ncbi:MAG: GatB/YqeY domain-containing protein, partial [Betaproteobacteria bacterium]
MSLRQRIHDEMKEAMRARNQNRLNCIRMLLAAIKQREVDERITLDDPAVIAVTDKLIR